MTRQPRRSAFSRFKSKALALAQRQKQLPAPIQNLTAIAAHVEKYFGNDFFVIHEENSRLVHVDVNVIPPNPSRPYYTFLTSGMSDLAMKVPRRVRDSGLAEVCLCLPKEWPLSRETMERETPEFFWPLSVLKQVARYPHLRETWLSEGHTIGSVERRAPLDPGGRFVGLILLRPRTFPKGGETIFTDDRREIHCLAVVPLLKPELAFKLRLGADALESRLMAASITELLDPLRRSAVPDQYR